MDARYGSLLEATESSGRPEEGPAEGAEVVAMAAARHAWNQDQLVTGVQNGVVEGMAAVQRQKQRRALHDVFNGPGHP